MEKGGFPGALDRNRCRGRLLMRAALSRLSVVLLTLGCGAPAGPSAPAMPTGTILAMAPNTNMWLVDAATGDTTLFSFLGEPLNWVNAALGPDGRTASGMNTSRPRSIRTVDLATREVTIHLELDDTEVIHTNRISPDGTLLAFGELGWHAPGAIGLATLDLRTGATVVRWTAPVDNPELALTDLQWLPDQSGLIVTAEQGTGPKWVARLDFASGQLTAITPPVEVQRITSLDLSPDGRTIAYALDGRDIRFITLNGAPAPGYPVGLQGTFPAFSPDGRLLAYSKYHEDASGIDGIWFHRFSDGETWRALPAGHVVTWVKDWE